MEVFLVAAGFVLTLVGIAGAVLPVLPGPLTGWFGLLLLHLSGVASLSYALLAGTLILSLVIFVLDYVIPAMGTKRFGGSKQGATGATIGMLLGLVAPIPFGFVIGAFAGAFIGELFYDWSGLKRAFRAAMGSFLGFLVSVTMKLLTSLFFCVLFLYLLISNWDAFKALFAA